MNVPKLIGCLLLAEFLFLINGGAVCEIVEKAVAKAEQRQTELIVRESRETRRLLVELTDLESRSRHSMLPGGAIHMDEDYRVTNIVTGTESYVGYLMTNDVDGVIRSTQGDAYSIVREEDQ